MSNKILVANQTPDGSSNSFFAFIVIDNGDNTFSLFIKPLADSGVPGSAAAISPSGALPVIAGIAPVDFQAAFLATFGFATPEDAGDKDQPNGYPSLDGNSLINSDQIPSLASIYQVFADKNTPGGYAGLNNFTKLDTNQLDATEVQLQSEKGQDSGYAALDSGGNVIPKAGAAFLFGGVLGASGMYGNAGRIDWLLDSGVAVTYLLSGGVGVWRIDQSVGNGIELRTTADAVAQLTGVGGSPLATLQLAAVIVADQAYGAGWNGSLEGPTKNALFDKIETLQAALGFTPENSANKAQNNGYASLDGGGDVPLSQLGNVPAGDVALVAPAYLSPLLGDYVITGVTLQLMANGTANLVSVFRFVVHRSITITEIVFEVTTGAGASNGSIAIFTDTASAAILNSGIVSTAAAGIKAITGLNTTLQPGAYYLAMTNSSTTPVVRALTLNTLFNAILNQTVTHMGTAANASAGGAMPATLGAITPGTAFNPPVVKLQA